MNRADTASRRDTQAQSPDMPRLAFVCPRLHEPGTVGGAEALLYQLARAAAEAGCCVTFLTTCARNHFTWENELPAGETKRDGMTIRRFPIDPSRDHQLFSQLQAEISNGQTLSDHDEEQWLRQGAYSTELITHLQRNLDHFDRVIAGPYLFGLVEAATLTATDKMLLVPCLHDEPFARVRRIAAMFRAARGCLFNTEPERQLAYRIIPELTPSVDAIVAMGIEPFEADTRAFAKRHGLQAPYVLYSGRREPLKGTPLLIDYLDAFRQRTKRDLKLVLTGSGPVEIPQSMRCAVLDLGFVSEEEKREAMAGAVAFCHPSVNESLGIVLIESWLAGTPALVHARGAVLRSQCEQAQGGLWFGNYPEFEEALLLYLDHADLRDQLGQKGREFSIRTYAPDAVLRRFMEAITR